MQLFFASHAAASVVRGTSGRLVYTPDQLGNHLPDFSMAGYKNGKQPLPDVATMFDASRIINVTPTGGDDTAQIQSAINSLTQLNFNSAGYRGVVQLSAGQFNVADQIRLNASGIILRGVGDGANPATSTIVKATGQNPRNLIEVSGGGSLSKIASTEHSVVDKYVPVGSSSFRVDSTSGWSVGDKVVVHLPSPQNWINDIGMGGLWEAGAMDQTYERTITRIEGDRVFLDAPTVNAIDQQYGGATVYKYNFSGRINNVGIENIRGDTEFSSPTDEDHAWDFIRLHAVEDAWVRNITGEHFVKYTVRATKKSINTTVIDAESLNPTGQVTGGRRYAFSLDGQYGLMMNLYAENGRHDFVNNGGSRGPNVFYNGVAVNQNEEAGPHRLWATGTLYDNLSTDHSFAAYNRGTFGSNHGWSGANIVFWNSQGGFNVDQPPTATNWVIGPNGNPVSLGDAENNPNDSLYLAQMLDRENFSGEWREYVLGDYDMYEFDSGFDSSLVDDDWLAVAQQYAADNGLEIDGFDQTKDNHAVPFTFEFQLDNTETVTAATLTVAMKHSAAGSTLNDSIFFESLDNEFSLADFGFLSKLSKNESDFLILEFTGEMLDWFQDGQFNVLFADDTALDWATLDLVVGEHTFQAVPEPTSMVLIGIGGGALLIGYRRRRKR